MFDNEKDEGWIALTVVVLMVVGIALILWEPDVEAIGTWIYGKIH